LLGAENEYWRVLQIQFQTKTLVSTFFAILFAFLLLLLLLSLSLSLSLSHTHTHIDSLFPMIFAWWILFWVFWVPLILVYGSYFSFPGVKKFFLLLSSRNG
jgi:hypothetical protein